MPPRIIVRTAVFLGTLLFFVRPTIVIAGTTTITPEAKECFTWFQSLGFPDPAKASWVAYARDKSEPSVTMRGFLMNDQADLLEILTVGWETVLIPKASAPEF